MKEIKILLVEEDPEMVGLVRQLLEEKHLDTEKILLHADEYHRALNLVEQLGEKGLVFAGPTVYRDHEYKRQECTSGIFRRALDKGHRGVLIAPHEPVITLYDGIHNLVSSDLTKILNREGMSHVIGGVDFFGHPDGIYKFINPKESETSNT